MGTGAVGWGPGCQCYLANGASGCLNGDLGEGSTWGALLPSGPYKYDVRMDWMGLSGRLDDLPLWSELSTWRPGISFSRTIQTESS